ncbi:MAG: GNAT family N-acetyltransferase [Bacteroidetes bacterium]|nr:GNAT family N-acetyltransferase [Bacteroidota bacterium]
MNNWIKHPTILVGKTVELRPLEREHYEELLPLTNDKSLWEFYPQDYSDPEKFIPSYDAALTGREKGTHYPFVVYHKESKKLIGSTMLYDMDVIDRQLEIGRTWLIKDFWKTGVNTECKLLLLSFCFETLKTVRVQLKATSTNMRSRKAIEKIGGHFEGILRKQRLMENGTFRYTAIYSIIDDEWETVKKNLSNLTA